MNRSRKLRAMAGRIALALVLAGVVGGIAAPARADDDDWRHRRDERDHERHDRDRDWRDRDRDWRDRDRGDRDWGRPVYVSPPPPVIYAPPPPRGLELIFPIHIR
jgi:hypothetical protein